MFQFGLAYVSLFTQDYIWFNGTNLQLCFSSILHDIVHSIPFRPDSISEKHLALAFCRKAQVSVTATEHPLQVCGVR